MPLSQSPRQSERNQCVFINLAYDETLQDIFVAYLTGVVSLGWTPRAAIETYDTAKSRLQRIYALITQCRYSFHDLSFVALDGKSFLPRFNMPLELGIAIVEHYRTEGRLRHEWFAFDSEAYRLQRSTSDLNGYEALIHNGTAEGVLRALSGNVAAADGPSFQTMQGLYQAVSETLPIHLEEAGSTSVFSPGVFRRLVSQSRALREG